MLPTPPPTRKRSHEEHDEQKKLIVFITNDLMHEFPILTWLHSIPNGLNFRGVDARIKGQIISQMIHEGAKSGVLDLFLPVRSKECSGLYIEMKSSTGKLSPKQKEFKAFVESQGFKVIVPRSAKEALSGILQYCGLPLDIVARI